MVERLIERLDERLVERLVERLHYVKNEPKLRHDISTSMSKISLLHALDAPKTYIGFIRIY